MGKRRNEGENQKRTGAVRAAEKRSRRARVGPFQQGEDTRRRHSPRGRPPGRGRASRANLRGQHFASLTLGSAPALLWTYYPTLNLQKSATVAK